MIGTQIIDYLCCCLAHRRAISHDAIFSRPGIKMLDLEQSRVRVRIHGDGPTNVVFLCDGPNVIEHYDALLALQPSEYRALVVEMPGFGCSYPKFSYSFSLEAQTAVLAAVFSGLGVSDAFLVAPCVTAYSGLQLAASRPDLVRGLCLIQAADWQDECAWARIIDQAFIRIPVIGQLVMALFAQRVTDKWYQAALGDSERVNAFSVTGRRRLAEGGCFCLASLTQRLIGGPEPIFTARQEPTLVIWGAKDRTHRGTDKQSVLRYAPTAVFQVIQDAGHSPELEQPALAWSLIRGLTSVA